MDLPCLDFRIGPSCVLLFFAVLILLLIALVTYVAAQSPNTASVIVVVVDQTGAGVKDAKVSVVNTATGAVRESVSGSDGSATIPALSLTGTYTVGVSKAGFGNEELKDIALRSGETATLTVKLLVGSGKAEVTVFGTAEGVRADAQIGRRLESSQIDETPILGRKVTSLPLLNAAFRQAKGTGDLFVNQTYFVTGAGSRRTTTVTLDGANNDEAWGRQTMIATVPLGAVQEMTVLSNAFSSEFGWTAGPALNIVTKSGTNGLHGEALYLGRPGDMQAKTFSTKGFCPPSVSSCVTPSTLTAINPVDVPDALSQYSGSIGGALVKDKTFFFATGDYTRQNRTAFLSSTLPAFLLPANGNLAYEGHYRQTLFNGRLDHKLTSNQSLMFRVNVDRFHDDNPQDAVGGTNAPSVARGYARRSWTAQLNHTAVLSANLLNEARIAYLHGDPVTLWEAQSLSTTYTRAGSVPFTIGQSRLSNLYGYQTQFSDTLTWSHGKHHVRFGGSLIHHRSGGTGSEPGTAVLGTFTFNSTTTAPFDQLTLANVQQYTQPIDFGINSYKLKQRLYSGIRAGQHPSAPRFHHRSRPSLRPADPDQCHQGLRPARRLRLESERRFALVDSRRLRDVLHADSIQPDRQLPGERARRLDDIHRDSRAVRLPHLPDRILPAACRLTPRRCRLRNCPRATSPFRRAAGPSTRRSSTSTD